MLGEFILPELVLVENTEVLSGQFSVTLLYILNQISSSQSDT